MTANDPVYGIIGPQLYGEANAVIHACLGRDASIPIEMPHPQYSAHVAWVDGKVVGVGVARVQRNGHGYLESLAVLPSHRRLGIATELIRRRCEWLDALGVPVIVAHSWCSRKYGPQSARALAKNGFYLVGVIDGYYKHCEDCPACRDSEAGCSCDAWEYRKILRRLDA